MDFFDSSKSIVENLYLLSGPLIAAFGIVGVYQIYYAKKGIEVNSMREAAKLSGQQVEKFYGKITELLTKINELKEEKNIENIDIKVGDFTPEYIKSKLGFDKTKQLLQQRYEILDETLSGINALEAFSTYFIKKIADEEIAFSSVGFDFCESIESLYLEIAIYSGVHDDAWQNTLALYNLWKTRIKKQNLEKKQEDLIQKLKGISDAKINPIGTK